MTTCGRRAMGWTALLLVVALCYVSQADARDGVERPENLLPDYVQYPPKADVPSIRVARSVARLGSLEKCVPDLLFGLQDTADMLISIVGSCVTESVNDVQFFFEDAAVLGSKVAAELREAVSLCSASGVATCVSLVLEVIKAELKPITLLLARGVRLLRLAPFWGPLILGCSFLPGFLPSLWYVFLDSIIFVECLFT